MPSYSFHFCVKSFFWRFFEVGHWDPTGAAGRDRRNITRYVSSRDPLGDGAESLLCGEERASWAEFVVVGVSLQVSSVCTRWCLCVQLKSPREHRESGCCLWWPILPRASNSSPVLGPWAGLLLDPIRTIWSLVSLGAGKCQA